MQFQKWPKINFWTGKKFKTAKNAIQWNLFLISRVFLPGLFLKILAHCGLKKPAKIQFLFCDVAYLMSHHAVNFYSVLKSARRKYTKRRDGDLWCSFKATTAWAISTGTIWKNLFFLAGENYLCFVLVFCFSRILYRRFSHRNEK